MEQEEMKIYVDKLPESCGNCPCIDESGWCNHCGAYVCDIKGRSGDCKLHQLSELNTIPSIAELFIDIPISKELQHQFEILFSSFIQKEMDKNRERVLQELEAGAIKKMKQRPKDLYFKDALYEYFMEVTEKGDNDEK